MSNDTSVTLGDSLRGLAWARKITERLRLQATNYTEAREKILTTLTEARDGGAADLLGYASWTAYMADVFGDAPLRLERDARQELVAELAAQGMSTRAIAPIVGAGVMTVSDDIRRVRNRTPDVEPQTMMRVNPDTGEVEDVPARHVTGMDGKSYAAPAHRKPKSAPAANPSAEVTLLNDIRLYLRAIASSPEVSRLTPASKQHLIDALTETINALKGTPQ